MPIELFAILYVLAALSAIVVGLRYTLAGIRVKRGAKRIASRRRGLFWQSLSFFPFYFTLPVLWIEWPLTPGSLGFSLLFLYFFLPYVKGLTGHAHLVAFNVDAERVRDRVEAFLRERHDAVLLDGPDFKADGKTLLSAYFGAEVKYVYLGFPAGPYDGPEARGEFRRILEDAPEAKGTLAPGLFHGLIFLGISGIFLWIAVSAWMENL